MGFFGNSTIEVFKASVTEPVVEAGVLALLFMP
jgi:hypothetical protein